jgi:hypothetical protein
VVGVSLCCTVWVSACERGSRDHFTSSSMESAERTKECFESMLMPDSRNWESATIELLALRTETGLTASLEV